MEDMISIHRYYKVQSQSGSLLVMTTKRQQNKSISKGCGFPIHNSHIIHYLLKKGPKKRRRMSKLVSMKHQHAQNQKGIFHFWGKWFDGYLEPESYNITGYEFNMHKNL